MKKWTTTLGTLLISASMLVGCTGTESQPTAPDASGSTKSAVTTEKPKNTFTMLLEVHPNWPYNKDWVV